MFFRKIKKQLPHEQFPQILQWKKKDLFVKKNSWCEYIYETIDSKGNVYFQYLYNKIYVILPIKKVLKKFTNISLKERTEFNTFISTEKFINSNNYSELLEDLKESIDQLK